MRIRSLVCSLALTAAALGQNDSGPEVPKPLHVWSFDGTDQPGPRPPAFPAFAPTNTARRFTGPGLTVREADLPKVNLRFQTGDAIALEAWVRVAELKDGAYAYLIGKGRTRAKGLPEKNQNYALRLFGKRGEARVSFLFASAPDKDRPADWHRWTTDTGFPLGDGWHHVAVAYTFGQPKSVRGFIDGKVAAGTWDMGGATDRAPVTDADDLQLGTGNGGGVGNSFRGWLDEVSVWRGHVPDSTLTARCEFVPQAPAVAVADVPKGRVLVQLCESGMPALNAWPIDPPAPTETYTEDAFGFFRVPHKYIDTGVRGDRGHPFLFRASAEVTLPAGKHRLLLRGRGASRLYLDGKLVLSTPFPPPDSDGHHAPIPAEKYLNLGPDFRFAPPGNREVWTTIDATGEHVVSLETIVGGYLGKAKRRPELGETVVAVSPAGSDRWTLLAPGSRTVPYTDADWAEYEAERNAHFDRIDAAARAAKRAEHADYWAGRRAAAKDWLASTPDVAVPPLPAGYPANNAIDRFVAATLDRVAKQTAAAKGGTVDYFSQVQPLLEAKCLGCHAGTNAKGKLRLDDLAAATKGGSNDGPAIDPGKPDASALLARIRSDDETERMPPKGDRLTADQIKMLETWIREGAHWPEINARHTTVTPLADDSAFLRRAYLDTVGVIPTPAEVAAFEADRSRPKLIDRLLDDPRWADHWTAYWLDVLAENPNILNPTLNNTGPFRWWVYESFRDNTPMDLFVTELVRMKGSPRFGGPAGFAVASQNDAPFAQKGTIVATAFLGVEMKCARCHDAPAHKSTQRELFELAALLGNAPQKVLATSSVPADKLHEGGRKPLIKVTLAPGSTVAARWPFPEFVAESAATLAQDPGDSRDRLAALLTAPQNERFAQVIANRLWQRLMGRGLVEPVDDWEKGKPTHPELLKWLGREFVRGGYDLKHLARLILNSHAYQRAVDPAQKEPGPLFAAPAARRLTAEQVVDSLFVAAGKAFRVEEASLDIDGVRDLNNSISLGRPRRAWMLTSTSNERDRPSLSLPRTQAVCDVLTSLGWRETRQDPTSARDHSPNVRQPAVLTNGVMATWLTRLSDDHGVTELALRAGSPDELVEALFRKVRTRRPAAAERATLVEYLTPGFADRVREPKPKLEVRKPAVYVSWSNHLDPQATVLRQQEEAAARAGDPPTGRLDPAWRAKLEDVLWALLNAPEFLFTP
jgi:mono/diheme cytochrome c family protein